MRKSVFCTLKCAPHSTLQNVFVFHTLECILHFRMCSAFHSARVGTVIYSQCSPTIEDNHQTALWLGNHSKTCTTANCTEKDTKVRMHNANITDMGFFLCVCAQVMERDVCVCVCVCIKIDMSPTVQNRFLHFSQQTSTKICETIKFRK